jgi:hypothetical protein
MSPVELHRGVVRVRAEFTEMPGLQLTIQQASRLFGLDPAACTAVIQELVRTDFLKWTPGARIALADT